MAFNTSTYYSDSTTQLGIVTGFNSTAMAATQAAGRYRVTGKTVAHTAAGVGVAGQSHTFRLTYVDGAGDTVRLTEELTKATSADVSNESLSAEFSEEFTITEPMTTGLVCNRTLAAGQASYLFMRIERIG